MEKTRNNKKDWLLGHGTESSISIGKQLPLKIAVMKRFLWLRQQAKGNTSTREIFRAILMELKEIWQRAAIPINSDKICLDQLIEMHNAWVYVKKTKVSARENKYSKRQIQEFNNSMNSLCDLSPPDVENQLKALRTNNWQEDLAFLVGQRQYPQTGKMFFGFDGKEQERTCSRQRRMNRKQSCSIADKLTPGLVDDDAQLSSESEQSIPDSLLTDDEYSSARATPRPSSVVLQIPAKNLTKQTGQVADSRNISIRDHLLLQSAFVRAGGGDINDMSMSLSTTYRHRRENRKAIAEKVKNYFPFEIGDTNELSNDIAH